MTLRTFVDSDGNEWDAFDVVPRATERRLYERRSVAEEQAALEAERRDCDRRLTVGGRTSVAARMVPGWLTFERHGGGDRSRLSPIPDDWEHCSDADLDLYRRTAQPVPKKNAAV